MIQNLISDSLAARRCALRDGSLLPSDDDIKMPHEIMSKSCDLIDAFKWSHETEFCQFSTWWLSFIIPSVSQASDYLQSAP